MKLVSFAPFLLFILVACSSTKDISEQEYLERLRSEFNKEGILSEIKSRINESKTYLLLTGINQAEQTTLLYVYDLPNRKQVLGESLQSFIAISWAEADWLKIEKSGGISTDGTNNTYFFNVVSKEKKVKLDNASNF